MMTTRASTTTCNLRNGKKWEKVSTAAPTSHSILWKPDTPRVTIKETKTQAQAVRSTMAYNTRANKLQYIKALATSITSNRSTSIVTDTLFATHWSAADKNLSKLPSKGYSLLILELIAARRPQWWMRFLYSGEIQRSNHFRILFLLNKLKFCLLLTSYRASKNSTTVNHL
jgi:hypothetical protein